MPNMEYAAVQIEPGRGGGRTVLHEPGKEPVGVDENRNDTQTVLETLNAMAAEGWRLVEITDHQHLLNGRTWWLEREKPSPSGYATAV